MKTTKNTPTAQVLPTLAVKAQLVAAEAGSLTQAGPETAPTVPANPQAVHLYEALGVEDSASPGADIHTGPGRPLPPSEGFVKEAARSPLARLGEQFDRFRVAYADGSLGQVQPLRPTWWEVWRSNIGLLAILVLLVHAGVCVDLVYGSTASALLSGASDWMSTLVAVALTLGLNGLAFVASGWLHKTNPSIVRRQGVRFAFLALILTAVILAVLALVVGGFDALTIEVATGGGPITTTTGQGSGRWLLTAAYFGVMILIPTAVGAAHLLLRDQMDTTLVTLTKQAEAAAAAASLGETEARQLAIALSNAYLSGIAVGHEHGKTRVGAYNTAFRRGLPPELVELFTEVVYDDAEPAWATDARALLDQLHTDKPLATVTRIA